MKKSSSKTVFSLIDVDRIAVLANIPVSEEEKQKLATDFTKTIEVINKLDKLNTETIEPTHQVTGLTNVFREDTVDEKRMLTQMETLSNAKRTYNGYFVVDQILEE